MGFLRKMDQAADLVTGMGDRLGHDMSARMVSDPEQFAPQLRAMVMACTGCRQPGACARLQAGTDRLDAAPDYCRNRAAFAR